MITKVKYTLEETTVDEMIQRHGSLNWKAKQRKPPNLKRKKKFFLNERSFRDFWDNIKYSNIHIIEVPEGEERGKVAENLFEEIVAKTFLNLGKETDTQAQEA